MKKIAKWEEIGARIWNVVNEGKSFTPVFVVFVFLVYQLVIGEFSLKGYALALLWTLPLFVICAVYDFPLHLRWYLWIPLVAYVGVFGGWRTGLILFCLSLYFFFTVIFWGTWYYHWRIGTPLDNYKRFWRMVLIHSDSTSGNAQEQLPKCMLLLAAMQSVQAQELNQTLLIQYAIFVLGFFVYAYGIHRLLFDWRPAEPEQFSEMPESLNVSAKRVILVVIDGCRKDRLEEAHTPFLDWLKETGTEYTMMETIYPARTVVCFSTIFTGAYPRDHGIKSNLVMRLGVRCESIFDALRKAGKKGKLIGIAHLIDAFGEDVSAVTAVMHNDRVDGAIIEQAKRIMEEEQPDLLAVQLIAVDQTGHSRGPLGEEYRQKIEEADQHIARFYHWLNTRGYLDDALFVVCADHGQSDGIGGHAHLDEGERWVPFIMHGPMVKSGLKVSKPYNLTSITPTFCCLLSVPFPNRSRGPVLVEAFEE